MNIRLYNPPSFQTTGFRFAMNPGLGLPTLSAVLNRAGHTCCVEDLEALGVHPDVFRARLVQHVENLWPWPEVIGITALTLSAAGARNLVAILHEVGYPGKIVLGGVVATVDPERVLAWGADAVVTGECEGNILELLERIVGGETGIFPGVPAPIETIPAPDWVHHDPSPLAYGGNSPKVGHPEGIFMSSRGCPWHCIAAGTPIRLEDGHSIPIEAVTEGMSVWGMDLATRQPRIQRVHVSLQTNVDKHGIIQVEVAGCSLRCTSDHLVWTKRGWVEAGQLTTDDEVMVLARTQAKVHDDRRGEGSKAGNGPAIAGRGEIAPTVSDVRRGTSTALSHTTQSGDAGEDSANEARPRIHGGSGREGASVLCRWNLPAKDDDYCRGTTSSQHSPESEQSCQQSRGAGENQCNFAGTGQGPSGASRPNAQGRQIEYSSHVRRATDRHERAHESEQSDEAPGCGGKGLCVAEREVYIRSQGHCGGVDTCGVCAEQGGVITGRHDCTPGIFLRRERDLLDRPLSERELPQSGLYLRDGAQADSHSPSWGVLAPTGDRYDRISRLPVAELESPDHLDEGTDEPASNLLESGNLATWTRVLRITPLDTGHDVYDLETWPDHNFFSDNLLVHNCIFCGNTVFGKQATRYRPPANVEAELKVLKKMGVQALFDYSDEAIGAPMPEGWMKEFADRIAPLGFAWKAQGRCSRKHITPELLADLRRSGCRAIMWGVESFSPEVLNASKKGTTPEDIWHTLRLSKRAGIANFLFTMVGNYKETEEDLAITADCMGRAYREGLVQFRQTTVVTALPGTELWDIQKREGWWNPVPEAGPPMHMAYQSTPWLSVDQINYWRAKIAEVCPVGF